MEIILLLIYFISYHVLYYAKTGRLSWTPTTLAMVNGALNSHVNSYVSNLSDLNVHLASSVLSMVYAFCPEQGSAKHPISMRRRIKG